MPNVSGKTASELAMEWDAALSGIQWGVPIEVKVHEFSFDDPEVYARSVRSEDDGDVEDWEVPDRITGWEE